MKQRIRKKFVKKSRASYFYDTFASLVKMIDKAETSKEFGFILLMYDTSKHRAATSIRGDKTELPHLVLNGFNNSKGLFPITRDAMVTYLQNKQSEQNKQNNEESTIPEA